MIIVIPTKKAYHHIMRFGIPGYRDLVTEQGVILVPAVKVERVSKEKIKQIAGWMG